jgi:hypothetical protein
MGGGRRPRLGCPVLELWRRISGCAAIAWPCRGPDQESGRGSSGRCGRVRCCRSGDTARGRGGGRSAWDEIPSGGWLPALLQNGLLDSLHTAIRLGTAGPDEAMPSTELGDGLTEAGRAELAGVVAHHPLQPPAALGQVGGHGAGEGAGPLRGGVAAGALQGGPDIGRATWMAVSCRTVPLVPASRPIQKQSSWTSCPGWSTCRCRSGPVWAAAARVGRRSRRPGHSVWPWSTGRGGAGPATPVRGELDAAPVGSGELGGDPGRPEPRVAEGKGHHPLLHQRAGGGGHARHPPLPGPQDLRAIAIQLPLHR